MHHIHEFIPSITNYHITTLGIGFASTQSVPLNCIYVGVLGTDAASCGTSSSSACASLTYAAGVASAASSSSVCLALVSSQGTLSSNGLSFSNLANVTLLSSDPNQIATIDYSTSTATLPVTGLLFTNVTTINITSIRFRNGFGTAILIAGLYAFQFPPISHRIDSIFSHALFCFCANTGLRLLSQSTHAHSKTLHLRIQAHLCLYPHRWPLYLFAIPLLQRSLLKLPAAQLAFRPASLLRLCPPASRFP